MFNFYSIDLKIIQRRCADQTLIFLVDDDLVTVVNFITTKRIIVPNDTIDYKEGNQTLRCL